MWNLLNFNMKILSKKVKLSWQSKLKIKEGINKGLIVKKYYLFYPFREVLDYLNSYTYILSINKDIDYLLDLQLEKIYNYLIIK